MACKACEEAQTSGNPNAKFYAMQYKDAPFVCVGCDVHVSKALFGLLKLTPTNQIDAITCPDCLQFISDGYTSFYRVDAANVMFLACRKHLKVIYEAMNNTSGAATDPAVK